MDEVRVKYYRRSLIAIIMLTIAFSFIYINNISTENMWNVDENVVSSDVSEEFKVMPCGFPVGIYLETNGVMVISCGKVEGEDGITYEPALDMVQAGDYIVAVNGIDVSSKSQLLFLVNKYGDDEIELKIRRNEEMLNVTIVPVKTTLNEYKMGIWVRDDTQGIGTMTYVSNDGSFGALGHGISDIDTGELLATNTGLLYNARIWGIKKGIDGVPGGLSGTINYDDDNIIGEITKNSEIGIFGNVDDKYIMEKYDLEYMEVAKASEVKKGTAYIMSMVSGKIEDYEIKITNIDKSKENTNRHLTIEVTDERLLSITNGIVQGMSGSPIIQNGKIIGAVTHVLVNDPTKGYGIFIESMLELH
ncbi:MAG: SpoIVB peptidase [Lachnospiraceae bacterium]|nr:SpoIVB peptidase [Lachnospiraceae bacterium]